MSDLSKIEAWIQQQDDELLYDVDGEQAHREYCEQLRAMTPVRFDCFSITCGPPPPYILVCSSGPLSMDTFHGSRSHTE